LRAWVSSAAVIGTTCDIIVVRRGDRVESRIQEAERRFSLRQSETVDKGNHAGEGGRSSAGSRNFIGGTSDDLLEVVAHGRNVGISSSFGVELGDRGKIRAVFEIGSDISGLVARGGEDG